MITNESEKQYIDEIITILNNPSYVIIVEGPYDKTSLVELGITTEIYVLNKQYKKSLPERIEEISSKNKTAIILTDIDRKGNELFNIIRKTLNEQGINVITQARELLSQTQVVHIEGLSTRYENLKELLQ